MHTGEALGLLRTHLASRAGLELADVPLVTAGSPRPDTPFTLITGTPSPADLRAAVPEAEFVGWANGDDGRIPLAVVRRAPPIEPAPAEFRLVAVVPVYDEADILERTLRHLVSQGLEILVIDNWSTDASREIAESWRGRGVIGIERFPADGPTELFDLRALLERIPAAGAATGADWVVYNDADEIRVAPWPGVTLRDALWHVQQCGYTCVNLTLLEFSLTDAAVADHGLDPARSLEDMFPCFRATPVGDLTQLKMWRNQGQPVDIAESGGHNARFEGRRVFPYNFLLRH